MFTLHRVNTQWQNRKETIENIWHRALWLLVLSHLPWLKIGGLVLWLCRDDMKHWTDCTPAALETPVLDGLTHEPEASACMDTGGTSLRFDNTRPSFCPRNRKIIWSYLQVLLRDSSSGIWKRNFTEYLSMKKVNVWLSCSWEFDPSFWVCWTFYSFFRIMK